MRIILAALLLSGTSFAADIKCDCVPYYQCKPDGTVNEEGVGIIDIRSGLVDKDNIFASRPACEHYLSVCCTTSEQQVTHQNTDSGGNIAGNDAGNNGGTSNGSGGSLSNQGGINGGQHISRGCGYRNAEGVGFRITGAFNNEANFGEFPWMVAILKHAKTENTQQNKVYQCGGSLVHKRVVLTAAHCVYGYTANEISIRAGEWDTQTANEPLPHQDREVSTIIIHPQYRPGSLQNDFALLLLTNAVDLADNVEVVCLPQSNENFDHSKCFATGWGKSNFGESGRYQVILKSIELPVVPHHTCQNSLRNTRLGKYFKLDQSFMCAGGVNGLDTCTGDGGSPLVCPLPEDPRRYTQAGIVAWGIGCGEENIPGVYADVSKARLWIEQTLRQYNVNILS